jgi:ABC-2 type transport system permease protein
LQTLITCGVALWLLNLHIASGVGWVVLMALLDATLGMALGLLVSAFAATEFQAVQFMPAFVLPQLLLCGLFAARDSMAPWLEALSRAIPLSYVVQALEEVSAHGGATALFWRNVGVVAGLILISLVLAAATLRRRTP